MDQLTLDFQLPVPALYRVKFYKNNRQIARTNPDSLAASSSKRRLLVHLLERSPLCQTRWEEDPRNTGWYGLAPNIPEATDVYHLTVERD